RLPIFNLLLFQGLEEREMFNTFNMGLGLCIAVAAEDVDESIGILNESGEKAKVIGEIKSGERNLILC
ncbi:MAG TPA: AIR synthase-related protein, partial [Oscillospiraceae bacterium]|nr:AIR synthase-related protein [Oscillospiraceae bacterium]